ncbi:class I SAM-dependent methyltransferase family protein [Candidatus Micrarchaeota archaeon]|nr:class I SAM-dependent methyltransferase family protein [Candidatus Micrarchaeota archaeon]
MKYLKVPRKQGEKIRRELIHAGLFDANYPILSEGGFVLFPVSGSFGGFETVGREAEKRPIHHEKLEDALSGILSPAELESLIGSFDLIGDIAIIEIPDALEPREKEIGGALLSVHKNLRTVLRKLSPMEGEFRVRRVKCIAGEDRTTALYKESGVVMELDVAKVYFSVRLSHERTRIASLVRPGERILALFAGVGPFPLVIAKTHKDAEIVAIELNPDAVAAMEKNIVRNKAKNVKAVLGDARREVLAHYPGWADRVLMPLPKGAHDFLDAAFAGAKDGGIVHFYTFAGMKSPFEEAIAKAEYAAKASGVKVEAASQRIVRPYSPQTVQVVLDLIVRKNVT